MMPRPRPRKVPVPVTVKFGPDELSRIDWVATEEGVSRSELIRRIVEHDMTVHHRHEIGHGGVDP